MQGFIIAEAMTLTHQEVDKMAETTKGSTTLKWKGEVTFEGTIDQFHAFKTAIEKQHVTISVSELDSNILQNIHIAGYIRPNYAAIFAAGQLEKLTEGAPRMEFTSIEGIAGGIRSPHLHLGDEVVLIDKERFKAILGEVARGMVEQRIDSEEDYCNIVKPLVAER